MYTNTVCIRIDTQSVYSNDNKLIKIMSLLIIYINVCSSQQLTASVDFLFLRYVNVHSIIRPI